MSCAPPGTLYHTISVGVGGTTAAYWHSNIDAVLAGRSEAVATALYNIGVNDFDVATQSQWIADVQYVADAINAKWPSALVYITKPWRSGYDSTANTFAGWVDTVVASRAFLRLGDDERVWLKVTGNTLSDGLHYSVVGNREKVHQEKVLLLGFN